MIPQKKRGQSAFSLIEGLIASLILAVALTALFQLWSYNFSSLQSTGEVAEAGQIARAELEWAKIHGARLIPTGTYSPSTDKGTWIGSFDPTANSGAGAWVQDTPSYYTIEGVRVASSTTAGARYSVLTEFTDRTVLIGAGNAYKIDNTSIRAAIVTVKRLPEGKQIFSSGTNLVVGGL